MSPDTSKRIMTAVIAVPVLITFFLLGGIPFFILIVFVSFAGLMEMDSLLKAKGVAFNKPLIFTLTVAVHLSAYVNSKYFEKGTGIIIYLSVLSLTCGVILFSKLMNGDVSDCIKKTALTVYAHLYINFPLSIAILLRNFELDNIRMINFSIKSGDKMGTIFLFFVIAVTFLSDTVAYFIGRRFGRTPLAPKISPKKSIEGAIGGILSGCATAVLIKFLDSSIFNIIPDFSYIHILILGFLLCISGIAGDLFESMMKRDAEIKDAGGLLPGHGGILDRLDSLSFTIPLTYFYVKIFYSFF